MCAIEPVSDALNDRTSLKFVEMIWTKPSLDPRKMFAEPVEREIISDYGHSEVKCERDGLV